MQNELVNSEIITQSKSRVLELLDYDDKGKIKQTTNNAVVVFREDEFLKGAICSNELSGRIDILRNLGWSRDSATITDVDNDNLNLYLETNYGLMIEKRIERAIRIVANENRYHPIKHKLESLEWDGQERLKNALHHFLGAEINEYNYEALKIFMMGALARLYEPGCKFEYMICIVGGQGAGKSTFLRFMAMADDWFTDDIKRIDDERIHQKLQGHWIVEMPEMAAMISAKNVEEIKAFLSRQKDNYRTPYEKYPQDRRRQCVFAGTTNKKQFLPMDKTGNRRFLPVEVNGEKAEVHILADEAEARKYIEQMWAEALIIYKSGHYSLALSEELQKEVIKYQEEFTPENIIEEQIRAFLDDTSEEYVCTLMLFYEALGYSDNDTLPQWLSIEISEIMNRKMTEWEKGPSHRFEKYKTQRSWKRKKDNENCFVEVTEQMELPFR